ncbi:MAG: hypothetical protein JXQ73_17730 [Phycisphaerae bacterium]|nr:hypothetical protein [Phycisphaerae bacterium]
MRAIICIALPLMWVSNAHAGMTTLATSVPLSESSVSPALIEHPSIPTPPEDLVSDWSAFDGSLPLRETPSDSPEIKELPPTPGSGSLFMCALGSLGAWHLTRAARKLNLSDVPHWLHSGGPPQVGHAVPVDLCSTAPAVCCFEQPVRYRSSRRRSLSDSRSPLESQYSVLATYPRGPPCLA